MHSEDSDQTGRTLILLVLSCCGSYFLPINEVGKTGLKNQISVIFLIPFKMFCFFLCFMGNFSCIISHILQALIECILMEFRIQNNHSGAFGECKISKCIFSSAEPKAHW